MRRKKRMQHFKFRKGAQTVAYDNNLSDAKLSLLTSLIPTVTLCTVSRTSEPHTSFPSLTSSSRYSTSAARLVRPLLHRDSEPWSCHFFLNLVLQRYPKLPMLTPWNVILLWSTVFVVELSSMEKNNTVWHYHNCLHGRQWVIFLTNSLEYTAP